MIQLPSNDPPYTEVLVAASWRKIGICCSKTSQLELLSPSRTADPRLAACSRCLAIRSSHCTCKSCRSRRGCPLLTLAVSLCRQLCCIEVLCLLLAEYCICVCTQNSTLEERRRRGVLSRYGLPFQFGKGKLIDSLSNL